MSVRAIFSIASLILTGCAGPIGLPFGPGPEADPVLELLIIVFSVGVLYRIAKRLKPESSEPPAIHILRERYARGELTQEQFQDMMRNLSEP